MEEIVLNRITSSADEIFVDDLIISFKGAEIVFLAQYIRRLEEKAQILNALLGKDGNNE